MIAQNYAADINSSFYRFPFYDSDKGNSYFTFQFHWIYFIQFAFSHSTVHDTQYIEWLWVRCRSSNCNYTDTGSVTGWANMRQFQIHFLIYWENVLDTRIKSTNLNRTAFLLTTNSNTNSNSVFYFVLCQSWQGPINWIDWVSRRGEGDSDSEWHDGVK